MKDAFPPAFRVFALLAFGGFLTTAVPSIVELVSNDSVPLMWWAARSLGLVAYFALWLSMMFGVFVAARGAGGLVDRATIITLHNRWALAAIGLTSLHVLLVVADPFAGISPLAVLVPMASEKLTVAVTLGTLASWVMGAIALTTAMMDRLPRWLWRVVHLASFSGYLVALAHGVSAGSESDVRVVRLFYAATAVVLVAAILLRIVVRVASPQRRQPDGSQ